MKRFTYILAASLLFGACSEDKDQSSAPKVAESFDELVVPTDFNWSSSKSAFCKISFDKTLNPELEIEGSELWLVDGDNNRLAREIVKGEKVKMNISIPSMAEGYRFYLPATGEYWPAEIKNKVNLSLADPFNIDSLSAAKMLGKSNLRAKALTGTNLFGNADMETNIPSANTNAGYYSPYNTGVDHNQWHVYDSRFTQPTVNGSKVFKAKNNRSTYFWQNHRVNPGDSIFINADHSGNFAYAYLFFFSNEYSSSWSSYIRVSLNGNSNGLATVVPSGVTVATGLFYIANSAWIDNAFMSSAPAITDTDGDGVADEQDDFPNDASKAYLTYYPTSGRQTVAFEDMWPVKGDYDFNDMIVNSKMTLIKDANNEWVSAEVEIALDAFGGGIENGLALRLMKADKTEFGDLNLSVSGDASLDPDVTNGIIVFTDPDEARSSYYTNTETGLIATPDTLRFTITFGANSGAAFAPDYYIFQTTNRALEIHLPGFAGTSEADASLYNTGDDVNGTYQTTNGLPWAMELVLPEGSSFEHPYEKTDMITAYPSFSSWAASGGLSNADWYQIPVLGSVISLFN